MPTLTELNGKTWYRSLKVFFFACYLPYFFLVLVGITDYGQDYHPESLPLTIREAFRDENFVKLRDEDKLEILRRIDPRFYALNYSDQRQLVASAPAEETSRDLTGKFVYTGYYTWNYTSAFFFMVLFTTAYALAMEVVKRAFYYVLIGEMWPKQ